jgi:hypothetical protein
MTNLKDPNKDQTRDFPASNAVPQLAALSRIGRSIAYENTALDVARRTVILD